MDRKIKLQDAGPVVINDARRFSVSTLWMLANQQDDVEDELSKAQKRLKQLKNKISTQSKKNFLLERDVRYLDSRIALLIQSRKAQEAEEFEKHLEDVETPLGNYPEERKKQAYGNLFFLLQTEPQHIATLTRLVNMAEIDTLLQTVMFTIYGNQYDTREEYLLLTVFQLVLAEDFEESEMGTLMRANTPVSRMMTTYTRRGPGQSYLKRALSDCFKKVIAFGDLNLEINPLKVYEQMINDIEVETGQTCPLPRGVAPEEAAENDRVKEIISPRLLKLREISDMFLDVIIASLDLVPYGIRWISKQIRKLTKQKFPDATTFTVGSLIGSFFMLRFINPAIVTPQAYMLIDQQLSNHARRTTTLVAKMLQNLTNKPNYAKEQYMLPLNPFVESNKERMIKFFNDLCEVEDFYEQLEIEQYLALTKKDLLLTITLNEVYTTHELVGKHLDELAPGAEEHLRIVMGDLGAAPKQLPRSENKAIQLPVFSRWEQPINTDLNNLGSSQPNGSEQLYQSTKNLIVQILRSLPPQQSPTKSLSLKAVIDAAITTKSDPVIMRKGLQAAEALKRLEADSLISPSNNYAQLTAEVGQELLDLEKLREKVYTELESLESVHQIIKDHNTYLRSQIESYRAYLQNVRIQTGGISPQTSGQNASPQLAGPFKFTHAQLERDGVIIESEVPDNRRSNIYFNFMSPIPGTFLIALHYRGREKAILELDLKLDDLLEKQMSNDQILDLEYVQFNVNKMLHLLNKTFMKR